MSLDHASALALLEWQIELGATEAILDAPQDRFEAAHKMDQVSPAKHEQAPAPPVKSDPIAMAEKAAAQADNLPTLCAALNAFEGCDLKKGARNTVFCDGVPTASVMIIGEAPGRDEDQQGKPFVGRAGQLLDKMFAAIGLARDDAPTSAIYITNIMPWRPPQNRDPRPEEIAMLLPFVKRHIALVAPKIIVLMGNIACQALIEQRGITKLRGKWTHVLGIPTMPMLHPAYLLRNPYAKRHTWQDLLEIQEKRRFQDNGQD